MKKRDPTKLLSNLQYEKEIGRFRWIARPFRNSRRRAGEFAGHISRYGYRLISQSGVAYQEHRLVWFVHHGYYPDLEIDHIDGDKLNNKICNLREVTRIVNQQNRHSAQSNNKTKLLGTSFHAKVGKYRAVIEVDGKHKHLGYFDTAEEAHSVYIETKRKFHVGCTI